MDVPPTRWASERDEFARLLALCPRLTLRAGDVLSSRDFPETALVIAEKGTVVIASGVQSRRRIVLSFCSRGTILLPPCSDQRLAALADSALVLISPECKRRLLQVPAAAEALVDALLEALREREENLAQFANVVHVERLRGKLVQLARAHGTVVTHGVRVELPLTHDLLAQAIGSARETVTCAVGTLEQEGFLVREGGRYRLLISPEILDAGAS